jgi:hypothetical protein
MVRHPISAFWHRRLTVANDEFGVIDGIGMRTLSCSLFGPVVSTGLLSIVQRGHVK